MTRGRSRRAVEAHRLDHPAAARSAHSLDETRRNGVQLVFLDIDGVLAPFDALGGLDRRCIERLDRLVSTTGCEIVIVSAWRETMALDQIEAELRRAGLVAPVRGATPILPRGTRADEIGGYLADVEGVGGFVILDDVDRYDTWARQHLVRVSDETGLRDADVDKAVEILDRSPFGAP